MRFSGYFIILLLATSLIATSYVQSASAHGRTGDRIPPQYVSHFFQTDFDLSINDQKFLLPSYSNEITIPTMEIGKQNNIKFRLYDNSGPAAIQHFALYTNLRGDAVEIEKSDTYIVYDKDKPLQVIDPHHYFSSVEVIPTINGQILELGFKVKLSQPMEKLNMITRVWDSSLSSSDTKIFDIDVLHDDVDKPHVGVGGGDEDDLLDTDGDGVFDKFDNCVTVPNSLQTDLNNDGEGDACDDTDGDGKLDGSDNCVYDPNPWQEDIDRDGWGDVCDDDMDGDRISNMWDNCPAIVNPLQEDDDGDGWGNVCDPFVNIQLALGLPPLSSLWSDPAIPEELLAKCQVGKYKLNLNFPTKKLLPWRDVDGDLVHDKCDKDIDGDGILNQNDNCAYLSNKSQRDIDKDGIGNSCELKRPYADDSDGDGVADYEDNCRSVGNRNQLNTDGDGLGNACDNDIDDDGIKNTLDNCYSVSNSNQNDANGDGVGDTCQRPGGLSLHDNTHVLFDYDNDSVINFLDNCMRTSNVDQKDSNDDGTGDACAPKQNLDDIDGDGIPNVQDNCKYVKNSDQKISGNVPGIEGDACIKPMPDADKDGVPDIYDNCRYTSNKNQADSNLDRIGNSCAKMVPFDNDKDGINNSKDNCQSIPNKDQKDTDNNWIGDACEKNSQ